jgi:hypothetical protein
MPDTGWQRPFDDPIALPRGRQLVTLRDAAEYITKLPKAEHDAPEWQAAMEALLLVADLGGPTMFARIGVMRAMQRKGPKATPAQRRGQGVSGHSMIGIQRIFTALNWQR